MIALLFSIPQIILLVLLAILHFIMSLLPMQIYNSDEIFLHYPENYTIEAATEENPVLSITGENGRIEIFNPEDFDGMRIHGFSSSGEEEFEADLVPKEKLTEDGWEIWVFFEEGDETTQSELMEVVESFEIKEQ